jgi:hypothetical protein
MRKFILNWGVLTAVFGVLGVARATQRGPRDWRLGLMWLGWGITVALAVGTVISQAEASRELED